MSDQMELIQVHECDSKMSSDESDSDGSDVPFLEPHSPSEPGSDHTNASELLQNRSYIVWVFKTPERLWSTALSVATVSTLSLLIGFTLGFPSSALLNLGDLPEEYRFDTVLSDLFGSFFAVGAIVGGPLAGVAADRWGRKTALLLSGIPYLIGYLMIVYAHFISDPVAFKAVVLVGRVITGIGLGAGVITSVYTGEISSPKLRGIFTTCMQLVLATGIVVAYAVGSIRAFQYYDTALIAVGLVAVFELSAVWLYETPRWLLSNGRKSQAVAALKWLRGPKVSIEQEVKDIEAALSEKKPTMTQVLKEFSKRKAFIPLILVILLMFFQQIGGVNAIAAYAATLFQDAGVKNAQETALYAIGVANLAATLVSVFWVDYAGRKVMLLMSGLGMLIGSIMFGTHFFITRPSLCTNDTVQALQTSTGVSNCNTQFAPLAIVSMLLFSFAFGLGWGPGPGILLPELLPLKVRGIASGIATFVQWATAALVTGVYLKFADAVRPWFAWWTFALLILLGLFFVIVFIPETKGRSLEEIQKKFEAKNRKVAQGSNPSGSINPTI